MLRRISLNDLPMNSEIDILSGLITQSWHQGKKKDYPNIRDLHELLALKEVREQTIIWLDDACEAKAFCILDPYNNLLFECADFKNYFSLFNAAVIFCKRIIKDKNSRREDQLTLDVCCWGDDQLRIECLKNEGFRRESIESMYFKRSLRDVPQRTSLPPGFFIRPLNGEKEIKAYVELHQKAFGTNQMTIEFRRSIMTSPEYDPLLDLVVQDSEGHLAAFCVCQIDESENEMNGEKSGLTDPIGVHPDFRNRGLAKALLNEGFVLLKLRGMDFAMLGTSSDNLAMINLAKSAGFWETDRKLWFSREVI